MSSRPGAWSTLRPPHRHHSSLLLEASTRALKRRSAAVGRDDSRTLSGEEVLKRAECPRNKTRATTSTTPRGIARTLTAGPHGKSGFWRGFCEHRSGEVEEIGRVVNMNAPPVAAAGHFPSLGGSLRHNLLRRAASLARDRPRARCIRAAGGDPGRPRRCRARVQCASNSSAWTGSPSLRRMTRLLKKGGPSDGASAGGSVGSPSHFR